jgi:hypothetical protein
MSSYHIDQLGRVVKLVPNSMGCYGCLYYEVNYFCKRKNKRPLDAGGKFATCMGGIFVEVVHD